MRIRKGTTEHVGDLLQIGAGLDVSQTDGITTLEVSAGTITVREADGSPSFFADTLEFPNGSVVQDGSAARISFATGGSPVNLLVAGTGISLSPNGDLTAGNVTVAINTSIVPRLNASNTFTANQTISRTNADASQAIEAGSGSTYRLASLNLRHGTADRWVIQKTGNAASNLEIVRHPNSGSPVAAVSIDRNTGVVTFEEVPMVGAEHFATRSWVLGQPSLLKDGGGISRKGQLLVWKQDGNGGVEGVSMAGAGVGRFLQIASMDAENVTYVWTNSVLGGSMIPGNGIAGSTFSGITSQQWSVGVFRDGNILVGGLIDGQIGNPGKVGFVNVEGGARPVLAVVLGTTADTAAPGNHTHAALTPGNGINGFAYNGSTGYTWSIQSHAGTSGSVGTIVVTSDRVGVSLGTTSTTAAAGNHTHTAGQVGAYTIAEVNNLLAGKANLTGATFTGTVTAPYINAAIARTGDGGVNTANAIILYPEGGALRVNTSVQGAIKIRLPVLWTNTMIRMRVEVHRYTGPSYTLWIEGYNYSTNSTWQNVDVQTNSTTENVTVRFGHDGVRSCIWIGNTDTTWSYPFVRIAELQTSHSSGNSVTTWRQGWEMSLVQSFDTVQVTQTVGPLATQGWVLGRPSLLKDGGGISRKGQLLVWKQDGNGGVEGIDMSSAGVGRFLKIASIDPENVTYTWTTSVLSGTLTRGIGLQGMNFSGQGSTTWNVLTWGDGLAPHDGFEFGQSGTPGKIGFVQLETETSPPLYRLAVVLGSSHDTAAPGNHTHDSRYYLKSEINSMLAGKANSSITISAGTGLTGGGNLTANRTLSVDTNTIATRAYVQGAFQPINAALNNIKTRTGSYGSINLDGSAGGYAGIHFEDVSRVLMVSASVQGFHTGSAWQWYFNNGTLTAGSVPTARIPAGTFQSGGYVFPGDVSVGNVLTEGGTRVAKVIISSSGPSGSAPHGTFWAQV